MAVGQNQWYHFGVGAPPIFSLVYWGYGRLTHGQMDVCVCACVGSWSTTESHPRKRTDFEGRTNGVVLESRRNEAVDARETLPKTNKTNKNTPRPHTIPPRQKQKQTHLHKQGCDPSSYDPIDCLRAREPHPTPKILGGVDCFLLLEA